MLLRLVGVMNLTQLIYFVYSILKGENSTSMSSFFKKTLRWLVFRHLQTDFFQTCSDDKNY